MTTDNEPEQQQIDHWLKVAQETIDRSWQDYHSNFYEKENIPIQAFYTGLADAYAELARAQFLNGEPRNVFRSNFSKATSYIIKSFKMAYDKSDPDYVGDKEPPDNSGFGYGYVDWSEVSERTFIEGMHYALMGADFDIARELAKLFRNPPDGGMKEKEVSRYAHALKFALMGVKDPGKELLRKTLNERKTKKTKDPLKLNYLTLSHALYGILDNDEALFNKGLELQIAFNQPYAQGEEKDTVYEFICDNAVALANLAISYKIRVTVEHYTLPKGMLMQPEDPDSWFA